MFAFAFAIWNKLLIFDETQKRQGIITTKFIKSAALHIFKVPFQ
jgi:hypothetical protein